jgi:hypothetical protein
MKYAEYLKSKVREVILKMEKSSIITLTGKSNTQEGQSETSKKYNNSPVLQTIEARGTYTYIYWIDEIREFLKTQKIKICHLDLSTTLRSLPNNKGKYLGSWNKVTN